MTVSMAAVHERVHRVGGGVVRSVRWSWCGVGWRCGGCVPRCALLMVSPA